MEKTVLTKKEWKKAKKEAKKYIRDSEQYRKVMNNNTMEALELTAGFIAAETLIEIVMGKKHGVLPAILLGSAVIGAEHKFLGYIENSIKVNSAANKAMKEYFILEGSK